MLKHLRTASLIAAGLLLAATAGAQTYIATLDGLQEVPPNASPGFGSATLTLDAAKMLTVHVDFSGLLGPVTAAHIHSPAPPGTNAAVLFGLIPPQPPASPIDIVVGPLTVAQESDLNAGLMYVNVHTQVFPGGEIRGQILSATPTQEGTWGRIKNEFK